MNKEPKHIGKALLDSMITSEVMLNGWTSISNTQPVSTLENTNKYTVYFCVQKLALFST